MKYMVSDLLQGDTEEFTTLEAAQQTAEEWLQYYRDSSSCDGWPEDLSIKIWLEVGGAERIDYRKRPDDLDEDGCDHEGTYWGSWDHMCDYEIRTSPTASTEQKG